MSEVPRALIDRWRSGRYIGPFQPRMVVKLQRGLLDKKYGPFIMLNGDKEEFGYVSGSKHNGEPWHGFWRSTGDWFDLPNVSDVRIERSFDNNGVATATLEIQNVVMAAVNGVAGVFHMIERGYMAPWRGYTMPNRPASKKPRNEWWEVLNGGYRIKVWQGYGDALVPVYCGLIDESKISSLPDGISVVTRDFGQTLTDQRVFGHNKPPELKSPIVFADRQRAENIKPVGGSAKASSADRGNPARMVTRKGRDTFWLSQGHSDPGVTEYVQVRVPKGRYEEVFIDPHYGGMEVYLSIYARDAKVDGVAVPDGFIALGLGAVPGQYGGHPYIRKWNSMKKEGRTYNLPFSLECGDNTVFRLSFRKLQFSPLKRDYRAGASRLAPMKRELKAEAKRRKWILVDDGSDIVKWALMWAGFHEWEVEMMGVRIKEPMVFHQGNFLIDIINRMKEQGDFVFYMGPPSDHPESVGVPVFRRTRAVAPAAASLLEVKDSDLLTGVEASFSKESLAFVIRWRGRMAGRKEGGQPLGEDSTRRIMAVYFPPWSGAHHNVVTGAYDKGYPFANRLAGLRKHFTHYDDNLETEAECMMACILTALQMSLAAFTVNFTMPGFPGLQLDEQMGVTDESSGLNTRVWAASISSQFTIADDSTTWTTSVGGSLIDTPDIFALSLDYNALLQAQLATASP